jgi:hypothetical protein
MDRVCFNRSHLNTYIFIFILIVAYLLYIINHTLKESFSTINVNNGLTTDQLKSRLEDLQNKLFNSQIDTQTCQRNLSFCQQQRSSQLSTSRFSNNLTPPERTYNLNTNSYQQLGFVFKDTERYPLYGIPKYPGRSDRWEYYIIDETRNRLKIPFKSVNDSELSDNDLIDIPSLGSGFTVKIYDYQELRYNPNI